ncbi:MAG: dihydroneopterin aldolase, partial [Clostridia bacterium]|nr:dihydroneopterin aldolase [Clostridia bacterium]
MDEITLEKLEIFANHGVYDFEKENGQVFYIDVTYLVDEPKNDDISCTVDYGKVAEEIYDFTTKRNYDIIEKLASDLATNLLTKFNMQSVT